jgi:hypothetical protein
MLVMEGKRELNVYSRSEADLRIERTDIWFEDLADGKVRIQVTVHNDGVAPSGPTPIRLESAPLGAFVQWRPLTRLLVPALEPGESHVLSTDIRRPRPTSLGDFDRVPPKVLLTAVSSPGIPQSDPDWLDMLDELLREGRPFERDLAEGRSLAPDLQDLLGRGQPHWAGNIHVFLGSKDVERHMTKALRIYPGCKNMAVLAVGGGKRDAYAFELVGLGANWEANLFDMTNQRTLVADSAAQPIEETRWVESSRGLVLNLTTEPPPDCEAGNLEVHITQRSTQKRAVVEFQLDPSARGSGCFVAK